MTQDEIIEMARQAHLGVTLTHSGEVGQFIEGSNWTEEIEAFAKLVEDAAFKRWAAQTKLAVQDEREACAKVCMSLHTLSEGAHNYYHFAANQIRERGEA